ncbi:MAG: hypothetical protein ACI4MB_03810, partial [Candidatus Coproplasma sp.]
MKKLITSLILSTALVGGVCATAGCTSSSTADKGGNQTADSISVADGINSSNELYSYGAASIGSIISASAADAATAQTIMSTLQNVTITETPVEGEEETTEAPVESEEEQTTETPVEGEEEQTTETPVEGEEEQPTETPVE